MAALPQQPLTFSDVFDDDDVEPKTVQHIRANSSIMQINKILGKIDLLDNPAACSVNSY